MSGSQQDGTYTCGAAARDIEPPVANHRRSQRVEIHFAAGLLNQRPTGFSALA
jgi:hypothetical protein